MRLGFLERRQGGPPAVVIDPSSAQLWNCSMCGRFTSVVPWAGPVSQRLPSFLLGRVSVLGLALAFVVPFSRVGASGCGLLCRWSACSSVGDGRVHPAPLPPVTFAAAPPRGFFSSSVPGCCALPPLMFALVPKLRIFLFVYAAVAHAPSLGLLPLDQT